MRGRGPGGGGKRTVIFKKDGYGAVTEVVWEDLKKKEQEKNKESYTVG